MKRQSQSRVLFLSASALSLAVLVLHCGCDSRPGGRSGERSTSGKLAYVPALLQSGKVQMLSSQELSVSDAIAGAAAHAGVPVPKEAVQAFLQQAGIADSSLKACILASTPGSDFAKEGVRVLVFVTPGSFATATEQYRGDWLGVTSQGTIGVRVDGKTYVIGPNGEQENVAFFLPVFWVR